MTKEEVIERISYFRNQANMSASELSLKVGKHSGYINKLENKEFNLPISMLLEIIQALNITAEEFFCLGKEYNKETILLCSNFNKLSKANRQTILDLIDKLK